ncbi:uncharacterized protein LOC110664011 isoform X2 [Hevea brasiliensis]|uniref:uncharacterized protein LOC110664011 isoform X2 n=1 Tax=Hevea brasiliensis TaxID=3981 RepID=UPI0025F75E28|nr:uncharacterized protein LOC110664011 isoform X2 [Hevea brasiliensis]
MKPAFTFFFLLFCLSSFISLNYARKLPEDYWKSVMKDQPIPEAIRGLLVQDPLVASVPGSDKINHFVKDFDTRPIAVIYQSGHDEFTKIGGTHGEDLRDDHEKKGKKSSAEHSTPGEQVR